ncbi:hypothetical protein QTN25_004770 [Entamoeba marina]
MSHTSPTYRAVSVRKLSSKITVERLVKETKIYDYYDSVDYDEYIEKVCDAEISSILCLNCTFNVFNKSRSLKNQFISYDLGRCLAPGLDGQIV